jgi:hypothetical protein
MNFCLRDVPEAIKDAWGTATALLPRADSLPQTLDSIAKEFALARVLEHVLRMRGDCGRERGRAMRWIIHTAEEMRQGMFNGAQTVFAAFQPLKSYDEFSFSILKIHIWTFLALWETEVLIEGDFV